MRLASMWRTARPWSGSIQPISGRPRSISSLAMPARRGNSSAGSRSGALRNWSRKWSRTIWPRRNGKPQMPNAPFELKGKTVYVAGHRGMVGAALVRRLAHEEVRLVTVERNEVDLRNQAQVFDWFAKARPQAVFLAAAKVGGIVANNTLRAEFLYDNIAIA